MRALYLIINLPKTLKISVPGAQIISLGDSDTVQVGVPIYAVGNPRGLEGTFSQGIISSVRKVGTDKLLQLTAPISPGSSGGPVLNGKGQVIGVSVATFRGGQNLNFAIPSNYLKVLVRLIGPAKTLSQAKPAESKRSILDDFGGRSTEGITVGKLLGQGIPFSFSLRNHLRKDVKSVYFYMIFYDSLSDPIDVHTIHFQERIPAGLAKRIETPPVEFGVRLMVENGGSVVFRILDFEIME